MSTWKSTRATNFSGNSLYNSSSVYNSDSDMSYSNSSTPADLISRFPIVQVSTFQPLSEDDEHSDEAFIAESCVAESCVAESRVKITLTKRQRIRNRATAAARARKAIQIPLRRENRMRLRDLVHIEMMSSTSELSKLSKLPTSAILPSHGSYCSEAATAADIDEAATAADTHTSVQHRTSTHAGIRVHHRASTCAGTRVN